MAHLMYALFPLVFGYSVYALIYNQYRSWYSWVVSSLVGFVYMFGFIMMTPQLFINYKLKASAPPPHTHARTHAHTRTHTNTHTHIASRRMRAATHAHARRCRRRRRQLR